MAAAAPDTGVRPRRAGLVAVAATAALLLDQLTKWWALETLDEPIHLVGSLRLALTYNEGAAFGIGRGFTPLVVLAGFVLLAVLLAMGRWASRAVTAVAIGMVVGGSLGNLTDRLLRDHGGAVVDFVDLGWWPVFNVADVAITVGAALLFLTAREPPKEGG